MKKLKSSFLGLHLFWADEFLFIFSISMLFFSFTFNSAAGEFSSVDLVFITLIIFIVCIIQLLLSKMFKQTSIRSLFLALSLSTCRA